MNAPHESAALAVLDNPPVADRTPSLETPQIVDDKDARPEMGDSQASEADEARPRRSLETVWLDLPHRDAMSYQLSQGGICFSVFK